MDTKQNEVAVETVDHLFGIIAPIRKTSSSNKVIASQLVVKAATAGIKITGAASTKLEIGHAEYLAILNNKGGIAAKVYENDDKMLAKIANQEVTFDDILKGKKVTLPDGKEVKALELVNYYVTKGFPQLNDNKETSTYKNGNIAMVGIKVSTNASNVKEGDLGLFLSGSDITNWKELKGEEALASSTNFVYDIAEEGVTFNINEEDHVCYKLTRGTDIPKRVKK